MIELSNVSDYEEMPKIAILGIGGGGCNAITRMKNENLDHVTFIAVNTDNQSLLRSNADIRFQLGKKVTNGFGAGADPTMGEAAAVESRDELVTLLSDYNMVVLTCGMGGGTGTGAIPIIADVCKELGILTVSVVTLPFEFENRPRMRAALGGLELLKKQVDTLLVIPNDKLLEMTDKVLDLNEAFILADTVLKYTIEAVTTIIFNTGMINLDFNDLKTTLKNKGTGHLGIGLAKQGTSLLEAIKQAMDSPLLETSIAGASNIILNVSGNVNLIELNQSMKYLREVSGEDVNIIWGTVEDTLQEKDQIVITLIATGMEKTEPKKTALPANIIPDSPSIAIKNGKLERKTGLKPTQHPKELVIPSFLLNSTGKN